AVPTTFIIDRRNRIRKTFVGSRSFSTFEQQVVPLLYGETPLVWERSGNQASLRWPITAHSFTLESTPTLNNAVWTPWPTPPTVVNGTNTLQVPSTGGPRYFRLRLAY
ncbi:MAG TPA: hypothetical protein VNT26_21150, partial [Candidatus Sulfotelmatobacter sp.]|nr:hypothetical protein [Candidatus Sulfotelmatobacter sp.]